MVENCGKRAGGQAQAFGWGEEGCCLSVKDWDGRDKRA